MGGISIPNDGDKTMPLALRSLVVGIAIFAGFAGFGGAAQAIPIILYSFSGELGNVDDSGDLLGGSFSIGDTFTGVFSYDPNLPDGSPSPTVFTSPANTDMSVQLAGFSFTSRTESVDLFTDSGVLFFINGFDSVPFIDLGNNPGRLMTLLFSGESFADDVLPSSIDLDDFSGAGFRIFGDTGPGGPTFLLTGDVTSLTVIPEPSTLTLFVIGLAGLGFMMRRRRKPA